MRNIENRDNQSKNGNLKRIIAEELLTGEINENTAWREERT